MTIKRLSTRAYAAAIFLAAGMFFQAPESAAQSSAAAPTVDPVGYVLWDAATVEAAADRLEKSLGDKALVWETIGNYDGHSVYLVLRGKSGSAEIHDTVKLWEVAVGRRAWAYPFRDDRRADRVDPKRR